MDTTMRTKKGVTSLPKSLPHARTEKEAEAKTPRSQPRTTTEIIQRPEVAKLIERLSSPRLKSAQTISDYTSSFKQFLKWFKGTFPPTDSDYRNYFTYCRHNKISEYTLRKVFYQLKIAALANNWPWNFSKLDAPTSKKRQFQPTYKVSEIAQMIMARNLLTPEERIYLAILTTWGSRREEVAAFRSSDLKDGIITLHIIKEDIDVDHLLPPVLTPTFTAVKIKPITPKTMTDTFHRICKKTGVNRDKGWGCHSIRRQLLDPLEEALAAVGLPSKNAAIYMAWSRSSVGNLYSGTPMAGTYSHGSESTNDPWRIEREIIKVHPFLKYWRQAPTGLPPSK